MDEGESQSTTSFQIKAVLDNLKEGVSICELLQDESGEFFNWRFDYINNAFRTHSGFNHEHIIGHTIQDLLPDVYKESFSWLDLFKSVVTGREERKVEQYVEALDRWLFVSAYPLEQHYFYVVFRDVTRRKQNELEIISRQQEVKELNEEIDVILGSMSDGVVYQDTRGEIIYFNDLACKILKVTAEQLLGINPYDEGWRAVREDYSVFPNDQFPSELVLKTGKPQENIVMGITYEHDRLSWVVINSNPTYDHDGQLTGTITVFKDITEIKKKEEELITQRNQLRFVLDNVSDAICVLDDQLNIISTSPSSLQVLGLIFEEGEKVDFLSFLHPEDRESFKNEINKFKDGGEFITRFRFKIEEEWHWLEGSVVVRYYVQEVTTHGNGEEWRNIILSLRNIDKLKAKEEALISSNLALKESNMNLEEFAYVASHDLQEPIRMVSNFTELLKQEYKGKLDEDADLYIEYAHDGAVRMRKLINNLLEYSRITHAGQELIPINASVIIGNALETYRHNLEEVGAEVKVDVTDDLILVATGMIERVFCNLIDNSIKFRKPDDSLVITIVGSKKNNHFIIRFSDNGVGFDQKYAERVFMLFKRLRTGNQVSGTGIGLAEVKKIIERHGGSISVNSTQGKGTDFFITLPIQRKTSYNEDQSHSDH